MTNIAMENGSFIDGLPMKNGDFHSYVSLPEGTTYNLQTKISRNSVWTSGWRDHRKSLIESPN